MSTSHSASSILGLRGLSELVTAVQTRQLSAVAATQACLDRVAAHDPGLGCFLRVANHPDDGPEVSALAQAAALGASLVVALNSDDSVRRQGKGPDRPVNGLADRLAVMAALQCIALVTWFDADTPIEPILACRPDVLVKGGDWPVERIVGAPEVQGWGGTVHSIPFLHQTSTTAVLEKIRRL